MSLRKLEVMTVCINLFVPFKHFFKVKMNFLKLFCSSCNLFHMYWATSSFEQNKFVYFSSLSHLSKFNSFLHQFLFHLTKLFHMCVHFNTDPCIYLTFSIHFFYFPRVIILGWYFINNKKSFNVHPFFPTRIMYITWMWA